MSRISTGFFAACCLAGAGMLTAAPVPPKPSAFHIVSVAFSDSLAFYYRILDVQPDGESGSFVTYSHIGPMDSVCQRPKIQSANKRVPDRTPADLAATANPCAVSPGQLEQAINRHRLQEGVFETLSFGIAAECPGGRQVVLPLLMSETLDYERFRKTEPALANLWRLMSTISNGLFGEDDLFHTNNREQDSMQQAAGEHVKNILTSGKYDEALRAAWRSNVSPPKAVTFESILANYRGPVTKQDTDALRQGRVVSPESYRFESYEPPLYAPLARMARVQGRVELQLTVSNETGKVLAVEVRNGHKLLAPSADYSARRWRFEPGSIPTGTIDISIDFILGCD